MEHLTQSPPHRSGGLGRQRVSGLVETWFNQFCYFNALHCTASLLLSPLEHVPRRSFFSAKQHQQDDECRDGCHTENPTPCVRGQQQVPDKVTQNNSDNARHLIRSRQPAAPRCRSGFSNKHRDDCNGKPNSYSQENPHREEQPGRRRDGSQNSKNSVASGNNDHRFLASNGISHGAAENSASYLTHDRRRVDGTIDTKVPLHELQRSSGVRNIITVGNSQSCCCHRHEDSPTHLATVHGTICLVSACLDIPLCRITRRHIFPFSEH